MNAYRCLPSAILHHQHNFVNRAATFLWIAGSQYASAFDTIRIIETLYAVAIIAGCVAMVLVRVLVR